MVEVINLPYETTALSRCISSHTVDYHYGKHYIGYVNTLNGYLKELPEWEEKSLEDILMQASPGLIQNNALQAWNHVFYFKQFQPPHQPQPLQSLPIGAALAAHSGSFEGFQEAFTKASVSFFGSGWVWLAVDPQGQLTIKGESNAGNPMLYGMLPVLVFDLWEHAFYLDYQNRKADHVRALWDIINWDIINDRYVKALAKI
jgi:Fe-Mn family superoxide dismutase